jgi:hypothetical protein
LVYKRRRAAIIRHVVRRSDSNMDGQDERQNDECGMMNDELKSRSRALTFITHHSAFIIYFNPALLIPSSK